MSASEGSSAQEVDLRVAPDPARHPVLRPFYELDRWLGYLEQGLLIVLLAAMIAIGTVNIVLQNAGRLHLPVPDSVMGGFMWADPTLRWMVLWVGMIGAMVATRSGRHLNMDAFARLLPASIRRWVDVVINLFAAGVCGVLLYVAFPYLQEEMQGGGENIVGPIQRWQGESVFVLVFAVMTFRFLLAAADGVLGRATGPGVAPSLAAATQEGRTAP